MPKREAPEAELRAAVGLEDLLALLVKSGRLGHERAQDVAARARTLASQVLKEKVGSVRSQAAARYEVSPAEIVAASRTPNSSDPRRTLDEDAVAECLAQAADVPYLKIDPLKIDGALVDADALASLRAPARGGARSPSAARRWCSRSPTPSTRRSASRSRR